MPLFTANAELGYQRALYVAKKKEFKDSSYKKISLEATAIY